LIEPTEPEMRAQEPARDPTSTELSLRSELARVSRELAGTYEELSLIFRLSAHVEYHHAAEPLLDEAVNDLREVARLRVMALCLSDDRPRLTSLRGKVYFPPDAVGDIRAIRSVGRWLMHRVAGERHAVHFGTKGGGLPEPLLGFGTDIVAMPIRHREDVVGVLFGADRFDGEAIDAVDVDRFETLASSLSIFLHNAILFAEMQSMFLGTLRALSTSIDAKDSYTHGHSYRVALLTRMLAEQIRLDEHRVERLYLSGLVHDLGKIGVPESVLTKEGPLTDEEFAAIKRHPQIGARILGDIEAMADLMPGVLSHHERWEGGGYPQGLRGNAIPFAGRVIALADSFDAMRSKRSYRMAMRHEDALEEIRRGRGTQFDPELADAFCALDFSAYQQVTSDDAAQAA
jgi:HD-GYP domain-containing protein (c-di-GMP phosphodiesterase class II)